MPAYAPPRKKYSSVLRVSHARRLFEQQLVRRLTKTGVSYKCSLPAVVVGMSIFGAGPTEWYESEGVIHFLSSSEEDEDDTPARAPRAETPHAPARPLPAPKAAAFAPASQQWAHFMQQWRRLALLRDGYNSPLSDASLKATHGTPLAPLAR